jgi:uncharacterized protein (DUF1697 family)
MTVFVALLRAVNGGGTGKLPMKDLKRMCEGAGFRGVRTFIASGNVVFESEKTEVQVKAALRRSLQNYAGKPVDVLVRTAAELANVLARDPFPEAPRKYTVAIFLDDAPPADALEALVGQKDEKVVLGTREIYVYYADGIGKSKLKIPAAKGGTARNMNTVAKLVEMATELELGTP